MKMPKIRFVDVLWMVLDPRAWFRFVGINFFRQNSGSHPHNHAPSGGSRKNW